METFGIIGMCIGSMGFIFGMFAMSKINKLEKKLKELKVLDENYKSS